MEIKSVQYDVFISYSRKDSAMADRICQVLDQHQISYFIDRKGISVSAKYVELISNAIVKARLFLFLASKNSFNSDFTQKELLFASNKKKKILPYFIDNSKIPDSLELILSTINQRNIEEHPFETVLLRDIQKILGIEEAKLATVNVEKEHLVKLASEEECKNVIPYAMRKTPTDCFNSCCDFVSTLFGKKVKSTGTQGGGNFFKWLVAAIVVVVLGIGGMMGISVYNQNQYLKQLYHYERGKNKTETEQRPVEEMRQFNGIVDCNGIEMKMVKIKAGSFMMGSPEGESGRDSDEKQYRVTLTKDYWMGKYEVTQAQYKAIMGENPSYFKGANRPVERVSWHDAKAFCEKLNERYAGKLPKGYRFDLPTEAQWEYACRAGTTTALNNGKNLTDEEDNCENLAEVAWYDYRNKETQTHPVGQKHPNVWGLYDMHGNVWEWCRDWYDFDLRDVINPAGPSTGSCRVCRGGSWGDGAGGCRSACRNYIGPSICSRDLGFRLALVPIQ